MMTQTATDQFHAPTGQQVQELLERYPPTGPSWWTARLPLVVMILLALMVFVVNTAAVMMVIWLALGGLFGLVYFRGRRARAIEAKVNQVQDLAMLRHDRQALRQAWRLLGELTAAPALHQRCVAIIGHCLDTLGAYEAAIVVYDHLLAQIPPAHPGSAQLRIQLVMAALGCDRLADADDNLRRLRGQINEDSPNPLHAAYRLATLVQSVRTAHFADAIDESDHLLEQLRPLGVEAGFGHALIGLCYHQMAKKDPQHYPQAARRWWRRATLLLPAAALIHRFPELTPMKDQQT